MKCRSHATMLVAALFAIFFASTAWAVTLSLTTDETNLEPGYSFDVFIDINDATDIVGCTFTVRYPSDLIALQSTDPVSISSPFFLWFEDNRQEASLAGIDPWENNIATDGLIRLAGVYVDPEAGDNQGKGAYSGKKTLFTIGFVVKSDASGPVRITLEQTMLLNPDAGWGIDTNNDCILDAPEGAPILIKANDIGSVPEFESVLDDFENTAPYYEPYLRIAVISATDSDGDGVPDDIEGYDDDDENDKCCMEFDNRDTDGDGIWDGDEDLNGDCDDNGGTETDPCDWDSDRDGVSDGDEDVNENGEREERETDPFDKDSDDDAANDGIEKAMNTDPLVGGDPLLGGDCPYVICIDNYDEEECHDSATTFTDAKNSLPTGFDGPIYYWIRSIIYGDVSVAIGPDEELLGIGGTESSASVTIQSAD